ncbi:MAG: radical SAM protein [Halobacteriovoraceae bacterium]|nr:radical SAM protein [Halobacteriovoraceae bacterium]
MKKYKRVYIEITNVCNLKCSFCPIDERQKQFMKLKDFESVLFQVAPISEQICLHLMGEPLAHPNFNEILNICEQFDTQIQLTTNGLLLRKHQQTILGSPIIRQVNFSLQSYMDNFPSKPLEEYLELIYNFIVLAFEHRPELYLNMRLWNIDDLDSLENTPIFEFFEKKFDIQINRNLELAKIKSKKLRGRLYLHFDSRFKWPRLENEFQSKSGRCNGLIDHFAIHADGTVVPCCLDDQKVINLGNVLEDSIDSILNSTRAKSIQQGFKNNQLIEQLCQKCTYICRFNKKS